MTSNFLLLHSDKTKVIVLVSKNSRKISFTLCITLASKNTVRNLGVVFDQYVSFNANIKLLHPLSLILIRVMESLPATIATIFPVRSFSSNTRSVTNELYSVLSDKPHSARTHQSTWLLDCWLLGW